MPEKISAKISLLAYERALGRAFFSPQPRATFAVTPSPSKFHDKYSSAIRGKARCEQRAKVRRYFAAHTQAGIEVCLTKP